MSEIRFNPITRDWVIIAPSRSGKPNDFRRPPIQSPPRPQHREDCPFCAGNEHLTLPEIARIAAPDGNWLVRTVPNKYPALGVTSNLRCMTRSTFRSMSADGAHEVVVEHPYHHLSLADMGPAHFASVLRMYRQRYLALRLLPTVESIVIFKNHGEQAGTSLEHPHSQIAAAPIVSAQVRTRLKDAAAFHDVHGECLYCRVFHDEIEAGERVVEASPFFVAFVPFAALSPYHLWIFPRRHAPSFDSITDEEIGDLSHVLSRVLRRLSVALGDPAYNFSIRSAPVIEADWHFYHWYMAIVPRVSMVAGFEMGSGMFINTLSPEHSAEILREAAPDRAPGTSHATPASAAHPGAGTQLQPGLPPKNSASERTTHSA